MPTAFSPARAGGSPIKVAHRCAGFATITAMNICSFFLLLLLCTTVPSVAADPNQRVWESERSDYHDEITGTEVWRLTTDPEVEIIPDRIKDPWSPDGSQILFRSKRNGFWHLYTMTADGSKITRVTDRKAPSVYGVWSRSGQEIICAPSVNDKYELHVIDVTTFASRRIAGPFASPFGKLGVSPDGEQVLFTRFIQQPEGEKQDVVMSSFVNMDGTGFFDSGYALDSRRPHTLWSATAATAPSRGHRAAVVGPIAAAHCAPRGDGSG